LRLTDAEIAIEASDTVHLSGMSFGPTFGLCIFDRSLGEDMASADGNEDTAGIQQRVLVQSLMDFLPYLGMRSPLRNAMFLVRVLHDALLACSLHHRLIGLR